MPAPASATTIKLPIDRAGDCLRLPGGDSKLASAGDENRESLNHPAGLSPAGALLRLYRRFFGGRLGGRALGSSRALRRDAITPRGRFARRRAAARRAFVVRRRVAQGLILHLARQLPEQHVEY